LETVALAAQRKQFVETPGEHNGGGFMYSDEYTAKLREFVDSAESADSGA